MTKYRKKPIVVEATQWFKNGDHPDDYSHCKDSEDNAFVREGKIVRRFRDPTISGESVCVHCGKFYYLHGWIETLQGGHTVCPGDWIITEVLGGYYPCKPDAFQATHEDITNAI